MGHADDDLERHPDMSTGDRELDCQACAACCRGAFAQVTISPQEPIISLRPELVRYRDGFFELARTDDHCAALASDDEMAFTCSVYEQRPESCRNFETGSERCLAARRRVGIDP